MTPEASRMVAGGPSEASDHRNAAAPFFRPRQRSRRSVTQFVFDTRLLRSRFPYTHVNRWSLASLGPPATVRDASGVVVTAPTRAVESTATTGHLRRPRNREEVHRGLRERSAEVNAPRKEDFRRSS